MKRIAALVGAIALVVIALVIRNHRDTEKKLGPYRLTCATEFADVCRGLDPTKITVTIEPGGVTADRLNTAAPGADVGFDGWLAAGPWAAIVNDARAAAGGTAGTGAVDQVGHARVAVAVWRDRGVALRNACRGAPTWKCIGEVAARVKWTDNGGKEEWGDVKIALPDPVTESPGLAGLAAATAGYLGNTGIVPAELAQNDDYQRWLTGIAKAVPRPSPDFGAVLTQGPAAADLYIGLQATITSVLATSARRNDVEVVYLSPVLDVPVLLARSPTTTRQPPAAIAAAVARGGWKGDAAGTTPSPGSGPLAGLRRLWQDSVR